LPSPGADRHLTDSADAPRTLIADIKAGKADQSPIREASS
jgi:hypothetical protein